MNNLKSHGSHIFVDYTGYSPITDDDGHWMLQIMRDAVTNSEAKEVHSHVEQFDGYHFTTGLCCCSIAG